MWPIHDQNDISLRDWLAGQALAASDWSEWAGKEKFPAMVKKCYQLADDMIAHRGKADQCPHP